jgi:hypothetical protein
MMNQPNVARIDLMSQVHRITVPGSLPRYRSNFAFSLSLALALGALASADSAWATEVSMTCERAGKTYRVAFDTASRTFRTDNPQLGSRFRLNRSQVDKKAVLVWVTALNFGTERDVLAQFGEDKWVKYFFGNGSQVTDRCT